MVGVALRVAQAVWFAFYECLWAAVGAFAKPIYDILWIAQVGGVQYAWLNEILSERTLATSLWLSIISLVLISLVRISMARMRYFVYADVILSLVRELGDIQSTIAIPQSIQRFPSTPSNVLPLLVLIVLRVRDNGYDAPLVGAFLAHVLSIRATTLQLPIFKVMCHAATGLALLAFVYQWSVIKRLVKALVPAQVECKLRKFVAPNSIVSVGVAWTRQRVMSVVMAMLAVLKWAFTPLGNAVYRLSCHILTGVWRFLLAHWHGFAPILLAITVLLFSLRAIHLAHQTFMAGAHFHSLMLLGCSAHAAHSFVVLILAAQPDANPLHSAFQRNGLLVISYLLSAKYLVQALAILASTSIAAVQRSSRLAVRTAMYRPFVFTCGVAVVVLGVISFGKVLGHAAEAIGAAVVSLFGVLSSTVKIDDDHTHIPIASPVVLASVAVLGSFMAYLVNLNVASIVFARGPVSEEALENRWHHVVIVIRASSKALAVPLAISWSQTHLGLSSIVAKVLIVTYLVAWVLSVQSIFFRTSWIHMRDLQRANPHAARRHRRTRSSAQRFVNTLQFPEQLFFSATTDCPVCLETLLPPSSRSLRFAKSMPIEAQIAHLATIGITFFPCGHCLHQECFIDMFKHPSFPATSCILCRKPFSFKDAAVDGLFA
eukprot:m.79826 g.79826  ORF g.79826 m.79826 type:complete len:658 (+) comp12581_c2_seq1:195-2168(+)